MKRFTFRLQAVLDLRVRAEQSAQIALGGAQKTVVDCEHEIADRRARRDQTLAALTLATPFDTRAGAFAWADKLAGEADELERDRLPRLVIEAERCRRQLAERAAERRAVEKLREKALRAYQAEAQRQEQIMLDEVGAGRHEWTRRNRE